MKYVYSTENGRILFQQSHSAVLDGQALFGGDVTLDHPMSEYVCDGETVTHIGLNPEDAPSSEYREGLVRRGARVEARKRILAVASLTDQQNMSAAVASGEMTEDDHTTYSALLQWIKAMRLKSAELVEAVDYSYADDEHWPEPPDGVEALTQTY